MKHKTLPKTDATKQALIALVQDQIVNHPHGADGFTWAAQPQPFYCDKLSIVGMTLRRHISKPPFVRKSKLIDGKKICLLRIGEAAPKGPHEYALIMRGIWKNKTGMQTPTDDDGIKQWEHMKKCLWGFAKDVPGEWGVQVFKYALDNWQEAAAAIKIAAEATPGYKSRFYDMPCIPVIRHFHKAVVNAPM